MVVLEALLPAQAQNRQIQRNQDHHHHHAHHDQNNRLDQAHDRAQPRLYVFFKEFRHRVQHLRQGAGAFAHFDHFNRQLRKHLGHLQRLGQPLALAHALDARSHSLRDLAGIDRPCRRLQARHQWQTAGQQRRQRSRKQANLVLQPDRPQHRRRYSHLIDGRSPGIGLGPAKEQPDRKPKHGREIQTVLLRSFSQVQHENGKVRELRPKLVIKLREPRHNERDQKNKQTDHQHNRKRRIDQRSLQFLPKAQRNSLKIQEPLQHFFQVAGALTGQQGRRVDQRKSALRLERRRDRLARLHPRRNVFQLPTQIGVFLAFRQQLQRTQNRKPGADQRQKLLVEDQEGLKVDLLFRRLPQHRLRLDRINQIPGLRKPRAQFFRRRSGMDLLLHTAPVISEFDREFSHAGKAVSSSLDGRTVFRLRLISGYLLKAQKPRRSEAFANRNISKR